MPTRKAAAVVAWLAVQPRPASRDVLAVLLWGPGRLRNLRQELYRLRKLPGAAQWLAEADGALSLRGATTDLHAPPADWDGTLLEDLAGLTPRFELFREELQAAVLAQWLPAQLARAEAALAAQAPAEAAALLDRAAALAPEDRDLLVLRETVAAATGDRAAALRARSTGARAVSLYADRLRRLLAVTAAGHPDWPGPTPAPALPPDALAAAIGGDTLLVADALAELERAGIVTPGGVLREQPAPGADAPLLHRRLAGRAGVTAAVAAWHLERAGDPDAAAARYLDVGAPWAAVRAEGLVPPGPLRARALSIQLDDVRRRGHADTEGALLGRLDALARDTQSLQIFSERDQQRARSALRRGDTPTAVQYAKAAIAHARNAKAPVAEARARLVRAAAHIRSADIDAALIDLRAASGSGDDGVELSVLNALGAAHAIRGELEQAHTVHERALLIARRRGDLRACVRLLNNLAATAERRADYTQSAADFGEVIALGERLGEQAICRIAALNRAQLALIRGRLGEARALLRAHLDPNRPPREVAWGNRLHGQLEQACGRADEARERLQRALRGYEELDDAIQSANTRFSLALVEQAPLTQALDALATVASPFLLATARMEALLVVADPDTLDALLQAVAAARSDPHAALLLGAGRARLARLRGASDPPMPPMPQQELLETPQLLALRAHATEAPEARAALCEAARDAARQQAAGLLSAQRDALLARIDAALP